MEQVSRPTQIALAATIVFLIAWFTVLKPGPVEEEPIAEPTTPAVTAGGAPAQTPLGQTIEAANNAAAATNEQVEAREGITAEGEPQATTPGGGDTPTGSGNANAEAGTADEKEGTSAKRAAELQARADRTIEAITEHLTDGGAAVVLVYDPEGTEDKRMRKIVTSQIARRGGEVRTYLIRSSQIGYHDGILGSLNLGQTPSTIVIAPDMTAKVLPGTTATERINRLTSAALRLKPADAK